jgi:hypothetical protein
MDVGGRHEQSDRRVRDLPKIDGFGEDLVQRICAGNIKVVGREHTACDIEGDIEGRRIKRPAAERDVQRRAPDRAEPRGVGDATPEGV